MRYEDEKKMLTSRNVAQLESNHERLETLKTAREVSEMLGISKRTLQYYNEIGLLKPSRVDSKTGYWSYSAARIETLKRILLLSRLKYSLAEIRAILDTADFDYMQAMVDKERELIAEREAVEELISLSRKIKDRGLDEVIKEEWRKT